MKYIPAIALLTLALLLTGCQSTLDSLGLASLFSGPARPAAPLHSELVEVRQLTSDDAAPRCCRVGTRLQTTALENYLIRTRHSGSQQLQSIEIRLNHQPLASTTENPPAFPASQAQVWVCEWPRSNGTARLYPARPADWACGEDLQVAPQQTILVNWPTRSEEMALLWRSSIPGSYQLEIAAIAADGSRGNTITQLIEVAVP